MAEEPAPTEAKSGPSAKDILTASDESGALKAYMEARKTGVGASELQNAMAEKYVLLGNPDKAAQFLILAGQTENNRQLRVTVDKFGSAVDELHKLPMGRFRDGVSEFGHVVTSFKAGIEEFAEVVARSRR